MRSHQCDNKKKDDKKTLQCLRDTLSRSHLTFSRAALACVTRAREHSRRVWCERSMKDLMWTRRVAHESDVSAGERKLSLECVVRKEGGDIDPSASGFRD